MTANEADGPEQTPRRSTASRRTVILRTAGLTAVVTLSGALSSLQAAILPQAVAFDDGTWWDDGTGWVD